MGAIFTVDLRDGIAALADGLRASRSAPWCPVAWTLDGQNVHEALPIFAPYRGAFAEVRAWPGEDGFSPERALTAIRARPGPTPRTIARFVAARLGAPQCIDLLDLALSHSKEPSAIPSRTLSRRVHRMGSLTVRNWAGINRLIAMHTAGQSRPPSSLEQLAYEGLVDPRSLRAWLRLCTDLPFANVRERPGWEWLVESALRRWKYVTMPVTEGVQRQG